MIDRRLDGDEALFIAPAAGATGLTEIHAKHAFRTTNKRHERREDDPIDVAVIPLLGESVERVRSALTSLREADPRERGSGEALYMAVGYPADRVKIDVEARTFEGQAQAYFGSGVDPGDCQPKLRSGVEIRVRYSKSKLMSADGREIGARPMHGMSGSGLWRVVDANRELEYPPKLVGIVHTVGGIVRATTIPVVVHALTLHFKSAGGPGGSGTPQVGTER